MAFSPPRPGGPSGRASFPQPSLFPSSCLTVSFTLLLPCLSAATAGSEPLPRHRAAQSFPAVPAQPVHLLGAVRRLMTASIFPRASDPHADVSHGVRMLRCRCLSYTTARPPLVLLIRCIMQLLGKFSAHSLCPRLIHSLSRGLSRVGSGGLCARASSPFPSPGASDAGVQGSPGTPGSMHPCVPGPREWALLHTEPGWLHGGGEAGRREAGGRHFCLPLQTESTTSQHKRFKSPPFFFSPKMQTTI